MRYFDEHGIRPFLMYVLTDIKFILVCQFLVEFLEVAIHTILKLKHIYPDVIFVRKQKYGNIVYETVHPELKEYISRYMEAVYHFAIEGELDKVAICFFDKTHQNVKEKVIFDVSFVKRKPNTVQPREDTFLLNLEKTFRSFFMNLNLVCRESKDESDLKFTLQMYTTESSIMPFMRDSNYQVKNYLNCFNL